MTWHPICTVNDIPVNGARRIHRARGMPIALFRTEDHQVFALLDRCPHKGGPLSQGIVFGHQVACPLHNWTIDLATGQALAPDEGQTPVFQLRIDDNGQVLLNNEELATLATELTPPQAGPCIRIHAAA